jgi:hypothetical protein
MPVIDSSAVEWTSWRNHRLTVAYRGETLIISMFRKGLHDFLAAGSKASSTS